MDRSSKQKLLEWEWNGSEGYISELPEGLYLTPHELENNFELPFVPEHVFESDSLTTLSLKFCKIKLPESFCLPSLKTLYLEEVVLDDDDLESLLCDCPVEHLTLKNCNRKNGLTIDANYSHIETLDIDEDSVDEADDSAVEILAPSLLTLNIFGKPNIYRYIVKDLESLLSISFNFVYPSKFTDLWKSQPILYRKLLEDFGKFMEDFLHAQVVKLSCWCAMSLSFKQILNAGTSLSASVRDLTFETEFWKCNLSGLVYVLKNFINLEVLTINVVRNHDTQYGDFREEEKNGAKAYWNPDDSSIFGLQRQLKTVQLNGFLGSSDTSAELENTTESILNTRDTEFVFIKFLLKNLTELETMTVITTEELNNFTPSQKCEILFQLSSRLLEFPRSSKKARLLIYPDNQTGFYFGKDSATDQRAVTMQDDTQSRMTEKEQLLELNAVKDQAKNGDIEGTSQRSDEARKWNPHYEDLLRQTTEEIKKKGRASKGHLHC